MDDPGAIPEAGFHVVNNCLIVPVASGLDEDGLSALKKEILTRLNTTRSRGVLINVSAVTILSSYGFSILKKTAGAVEIMGTRAVFVGFQPGVAAALVDFNADLSGIQTAVSMEDAFELLAGENKNHAGSARKKHLRKPAQGACNDRRLRNN